MIDALPVILLAGLGCAAVGLFGYWAAVAYHVGRTIALIPTARRGLSLPLAEAGASPPRLCVLVPAHNEQSCIAALAASLAAQDYPSDPPNRISMVFILDRCTDQTRAVLDAALAKTGAAARAEIIELDACPPGWIGKTHALWSGVQASPPPARPTCCSLSMPTPRSIRAWPGRRSRSPA